MNQYTLGSESRRWWWLTGLAGTIATALVTALFVVGTVSASATHPSEDPGPPRGPGISQTTPVYDAPCFAEPATWSPSDGPIPRCPI